MFERPERGERAVLVHTRLTGNRSDTLSQQDCDEFVELVASAGVQQTALVLASRESPDPTTYVGSGKVDELAAAVETGDAEVVIFDRELTPSQERNLERKLSCRVLDRTGLILDIFAQRARSHEGKLQVELAQLQHLSTRLVRGWTHLERQKGGIGLRGPGEKQLETDRRLLAERIRTLRKRLEKVSRQRDQGRQARKKADISSISLVGYTNAGKSTLFNTLAGESVYAADQLFATLDPTLRKILLPNRQPVILADTVGFIRDLPHDLIAAFRATLQETAEADVLLHVIDASDPKRFEYMQQVEQVLTELGASDRPQIQVFNKIDLTDVPPHWEPATHGNPPRVWVSAKTAAGFAELFQAITVVLGDVTSKRYFELPVIAGKARAQLYASGGVVKESMLDDGSNLVEVCLTERQWGRLLGAHPELQAYTHSPAALR